MNEIYINYYINNTLCVFKAVLALPNAGPSCDPRGCPLKVIVQCKKRANVLV
jgi:hypothetical protein